MLKFLVSKNDPACSATTGCYKNEVAAPSIIEKLSEANRCIFGNMSFRPQQIEIITTVLDAKKDVHLTCVYFS